MIPELEILTSDIEEVEYPTETYKIEVRTNYEEDRIFKFTDAKRAEKFLFKLFNGCFYMETMKILDKVFDTFGSYYKLEIQPA